jgi:carbonic anhydrase/acetyltransferase-like protein (isoleucine patch superfamily)
MTEIFALDGAAPEIAADAFVAPGARLVGRVVLRPQSSVWFNAVLRGDNEPVVVGEGSNVQDCCVLHTDMGYPLAIGAGCTIGHSVILHGCTIGDGTLVGMGAAVMNGARIGPDSLVGAGALVTEMKEFPPGALVIGRPAKVARMLTEAEIEGLRTSAERYRSNARRFRAGLTRPRVRQS